MTGSTLSEDLALLFLGFPDWIEQGAYWVLLGFILFVGFALAWLIQASRRRKAVFRLWHVHQRQQQEQLEECRLLAEDQLIEQASQLAYRARRIEQLKAVIARQQEHPHTTVPQALAIPCLPAPAHTLTAAQQTTARTASRPVGAPLHAPPISRVAATAHAAATHAVAPHAIAAQAQAQTQALAQAQARIRETVQTMMKQRLARELALGRERARLLRRYEAESAYWQEACRHSQAACDNLQAAVTALEHALHDTRATWAAAEREVERLREQLQQQAQALAPRADMAASHGRFDWRAKPGSTEETKDSPSHRILPHYSALVGARRLGTPLSSRLDQRS